MPPRPGSPPWPLITLLLIFRDIDQILQCFRSQGPIRMDNNVITAYRDYTVEVQRKRASFTKVKQLLCDSNLTYSLLFPAHLWVIDGERTHIFSSLEDAWTWLHAKGLVDPTKDDPQTG
ncbi:hypothetical protein NDU88_005188 [Pleurodeles waltl]|uniref:Uncharacterized protein n=1 Tax=Pleurodeles waltl TaxID=8319 RepID=A0AAV7NQS7_PLEWA|nr:hypothetical protein NDU88_005188 [Pleurodeles waltl]